MLVTDEKREWLERIRDIFNNKIPFNQVLGLRVHALDTDRPKIRFDMHEALVGNYIKGSLHGGVVSAVIDVTGGLAAFMGLQKSWPGNPWMSNWKNFASWGPLTCALTTCVLASVSNLRQPDMCCGPATRSLSPASN